ncbi:MAG: hypothetical protein ABSD58_09495 [Verrucomicrobiia bacterium]
MDKLRYRWWMDFAGWGVGDVVGSGKFFDIADSFALAPQAAVLTPLTPVRVALRVPRRHGLFATQDTAWSRLVRLGLRLPSPLGLT